MPRSKFVAAFVLASVIIGLLAAQYSLQNPAGGADLITNDEPIVAGDVADPASGSIEAAPPRLGQANDLDGLGGWLQTDATGFDSFSGQVRVCLLYTSPSPRDS